MIPNITMPKNCRMEVRLVITSLHVLYAVMCKRNEGVLRQNSVKIREFEKTICELSFLTGKKGEISAYLLAFNADALKVSTKTRSCPTNTLYL